MLLRTFSILLLLLYMAIPALAETGILEIYSTPSGAEVFVDNIYVGLTPFAKPDISVGRHQVSVLLEKTGVRQDFAVAVDALKPQIHKLNFQQSRPHTFNGIIEKPTYIVDRGNIQLASIPTGARVEINGRELATTPVSFRDADSGVYQFKFLLKGQLLEGQFRINKNETGKLIADFERGIIVNKWQEEKSKRNRKENARKKHLLLEKEQAHEEQTMVRLQQLQPEVRERILRARDQQYEIISIGEMYGTNRSYYYNAINLDPIVVEYYKLPYDRLTLELKNLTKEKSSRQGNYFEGDYVFRYGKHTRRGRLNSNNLASCRFTLYNDLTIKVRYDPDDYGAGRGKGKIFVSVR